MWILDVNSNTRHFQLFLAILWLDEKTAGDKKLVVLIL